jgi:hypothetical protein
MRNKIEDLIDINSRKGLPRSYRFNPFLRWFTFIFALAAIAYAIWMIWAKINASSPGFYKIVPFIILFLALNSLLKNLFSLNAVKIAQDQVVFSYWGRKSVKLKWENLERMEFSSGKQKQIVIKFHEDGVEKLFSFTINFPNMLEIVNSIAEMCPHLEFDDFMKNVIVSPAERNKYYRKDTD